MADGRPVITQGSAADPFKDYGEVVGDLTEAKRLIRMLVSAGDGVVADSGAAGTWASLYVVLDMAREWMASARIAEPADSRGVAGSAGCCGDPDDCDGCEEAA